MNNEITRVVEIEHKGEKLYVQVHVHLSKEEIERIVAPAVLKSLSNQLRRQSLMRVEHVGRVVPKIAIEVPLSVDPDDYPIV